VCRISWLVVAQDDWGNSVGGTLVTEAARRLDGPDVGKLRAPGDLVEQIAEQAMVELPLTVRHGLAVGHLPLHHRDPFDRCSSRRHGAKG
jgi:hypothetical protein